MGETIAPWFEGPMSASRKTKKHPKNVTKSRANPSRSIDNPEDDHPMGLWVNTDFFRKLTTRVPRISLRDGTPVTANRYLELADLVLNGKPKKSSK